MKKEELQKLITITDLANYKRNINDENIIEFELNGEIIFLSVSDESIIRVESIGDNNIVKDKNTIEELQKYIFKFGNKIYYPNFKNEYLLELNEPLQFVDKEILFASLSVIINSNSLYTSDEIIKLQIILMKLKTYDFNIYDFFKIQKVIQITMFIHYFYKDGINEKAMAIASLEITNTYARAEDDKDLIDMKYIYHCAKHKNFNHIGDYLKGEVIKILEGLLRELKK